MIYLFSFLVCGAFCAIGQMIYDNTKLSAGHITSIFVVTGVILEFGGLYDKLIDFAGFGAALPIVSFGHSLMHAAMEGAADNGFLGIAQNLFSTTSAGIVFAVVFAFIIAIIFKPKT